MYGKASLETSSSQTAARTSRARGPQRPMQHSADVLSSSTTEPSHGR